MAGRPLEVLYEDDTQKPEVGKQKTDKLIESDHVNFLTGYGFSNVLLASLLPAVNSQTFIISANAGPSQIAGELCSPWFFSASWQGDQVPQAVGEYMNQRKRKDGVPDCAKIRRWQRRPGRCQGQLSWSDPGRGLYQMAGPARLLGGIVESARNQTGRNLRFLSRSGRYPIFDAILPIWSARSNTPLYRFHHRCAFSAAIR